MVQRNIRETTPDLEAARSILGGNLLWVAIAFLLVAVWAASKGSQRVHDWIYDQPQFARLINDWHDQRAVPVSAKWLATAMMLISLASLVWMQSHWGLVLGMSLFFMCIGIFLWTRPNPRHEPGE